MKEIYKLWISNVEMIMKSFPIHTYGTYILTSSNYGVDIDK